MLSCACFPRGRYNFFISGFTNGGKYCETQAPSLSLLCHFIVRPIAGSLLYCIAHRYGEPHPHPHLHAHARPANRYAHSHRDPYCHPNAFPCPHGSVSKIPHYTFQPNTDCNPNPNGHSTNPVIHFCARECSDANACCASSMPSRRFRPGASRPGTICK